MKPATSIPEPVRNMSAEIDTTFDVYSDTPKGKDPDSFSPTLRRYHRALWSKALPDGRRFDLTIDQPGCYLHHCCDRRDLVLSSDSIGHTYRYVKAMSHIVGQATKEELDAFFSICSTVGAYMVFPARKIDGKATINGARGMNGRIRDRFDLTLECIRRHYLNLESPLRETLGRYGFFFDLFGDFAGYVEFFLLQDLVETDRSAIRFFLPFRGFDGPPLPATIEEYRAYKNNVVTFISARNQRIAYSQT